MRTHSKAKRIKPKVGDIFEIRLPDDRFAYGKVFRDASIGVYEKIFSSPAEPPINSSFAFIVGLYADIGKKLPVKERAQMFLYFENQRIKEDLRCVYFKKGQYGFAPPGTNDMQMTNSPVMWSVGKLLKGEFPKSKGGSA